MAILLNCVGELGPYHILFFFSNIQPRLMALSRSFFFLWNFDSGFVLVIEMFIMAYLVDVKG